MVSLLLVADINQVDKRGQEREYVLGIATLGPEERPILSQRDEGWAEAEASQPANRPPILQNIQNGIFQEPLVGSS